MIGAIQTRIFLFLVAASAVATPFGTSAQSKSFVRSTVAPVMWTDVGDISERDLRYGPGSADLAPSTRTHLSFEAAGEMSCWKVASARPSRSGSIASSIVFEVAYDVMIQSGMRAP